MNLNHFFPAPFRRAAPQSQPQPATLQGRTPLHIKRALKSAMLSLVRVVSTVENQIAAPWRMAVVLLAFAASGSIAEAQIALWNYQNTVAASGVAANMTASTATITPAQTVAFQAGTDDGGTVIGNSGSWSTGNFATSGKYIQFSVTPNSGYNVELTSVTIRLGRTAAGPQQFTAQYSLNGFATAGTSAGSGSVASTSTANLNSFTLSVPSGAQTGTITFRVWGHNASGTGNFRFNNFRVFGTVSAASTPPTVTTTAASVLAATSATMGGNVTAAGSASVTDRGVAYKTSATVTIADNKTQIGSGTGSFSQSIGSLSVNTRYWHRAYAISTAGTSLGSELNFWTLANVPGQPTVGGATPSSLNVTLNANGNPAATEFSIRVGGQFVQASGALGATEVWQTATAWGSPRTVTGLAPSTTYTFDVRARNGANTVTAFGASQNGTTSAGSTPPTVTTTAASSLGTTSATMGGNVTADGGASVTDRGVVYKTSATVTIADNKTQIGSGTGSFSQSIGSLSVNTRYWHRAYAINSVGTTLGSELNFWTLANVPSAPTVSTPTATTLNVAVNANGNPAGTEFAIRTGGQFVQANGTLGASAVWQTAATWGTRTVSGLASGTTHNFDVKARNGAGTETAFSPTASGLTIPGQPATPTAASITTTGFTVNWSATTGASSYRLDLATDSGFTAMVGGYNNLTVAGTSQAVSGLTPGQTYYVRVRAVNASGTGVNSATLTQAADCFTTVTATAASAVAGTSFNANWNTVSGATGYILDVATNSAFSAGGSSVFESFETGLPTGYTTVTNYTLSSGEWTGASEQVIRGTTGVESGSYSLQLRSQTGAHITTPTITGGVGTISFYVTSSTASGGLQVRVSTDNGANWTQVSGSPLSFGTTKTFQSFTVDDANVNRIQLYRTAATVYIDDVEWTTTGGGDFVAGYESRDVGNVTSFGVTGLTAGVTYYYRVLATNEFCTSDHSNTQSVTTVSAPPAITLADNGTQVGAANVAAGTTAHVLHKFSAAVTTANATLTNVAFATAGTYLTADLTNLKLRYSTDAVLDAGDATLSTIPTPAAAGAKTFTGLSQTINAGSTGYFFITADIAASPTAGRTISVNAIGTADLTFSSGNKSGSTTAGGAQTIVPAEPTMHASALVFSSVQQAQMTLAWTIGDGDRRIVVARAGGATSWAPTDGTAPTGVNAHFASSTDQGGGNRIVYDGTGTGFTATGLDTGTTYFFTVFEYNGTGIYVNYYTTGTPLAGSQTTDCQSPPATLWANPTNMTDFTANWSAVGGATGYRIDVSTTADFSGAAANLVDNPGFETGDFTGWDTAEANYAVASSDPHEGTYHVTCSATDTRKLNQSVSITGDGVTEYEVSFWYKKPSGSGNARIWSSWTSGGQLSGDNLQSSTYLPAAADWTQVTYTVVPQSGANTLNFEVRTYNGATVLYDNFFVGVAGGGSGSFVPGFEDLAVAGTSVSVTGLTQNVTYYWRVRTEGSDCTSASSATESVTTLTGPVLLEYVVEDALAVPNEVTDGALRGGSVEIGFTYTHATGMKLAGSTYQVLAPDGTVVVSSRAFDAIGAATVGGTNGQILTATTPGIDPAVLGVYTARVEVVSSNDMSATGSGAFTVVDDDVAGPVHSGFNVAGAVFQANQMVGGLVVTGWVADASGVFAGTSNAWSLASNGTLIASGSMAMLPNSNGAGMTGSPAALSVTIATNFLTPDDSIAYVFSVVSTDFDVDRPGDTLSTSNAYSFQVIPQAPDAPTDVTAVADGPELMDLAWNKNGASGVLVLWSTNAVADAPTQGQAYAPGDSVGGARVVYKGSADALELVVPPGVSHYFRLHGAAGNAYSTTAAEPATTPVATAAYEDGEIIDQFAYTNGNSLAAGAIAATGQGWDGLWTGDLADWSIEDGSLSTGTSGFPDPYANRIVWDDTSAAAADSSVIVRELASPRSGRTFVSFMLNYASGGPGKSAGLWLASGVGAGTEELFFGKVAGQTDRAGIYNPDGAVTTASTVSLTPGADMMVVGEFDSAQKTVRIWAFAGTDLVPQDYTNATPAATYSNASLSVAAITGIRLEAESDATGALGEVRFDEVRLANTWDEALNLNLPKAFNFQLGTLVNGTNILTDGELSELGKSYPVSFALYHRTGVTNAQYTIVTNLASTNGLYATNIPLRLDPADANDKTRTFTNLVTTRLAAEDVALGIHTSRVFMTAVSGKATNTVTMEGQAGAPDLFFGEFGEGRYYDKYVEIYNGSGGSIDLSQYMIAKQTYGGTVFPDYTAPWDNFCRLSPDPLFLDHNQTILILNGETIQYSSPDATLDDMTNALAALGRPYLITTNNALQVSGNDPVGLFKVGNTNNWIDMCAIAPAGGTGSRYIMTRMENAEVPRPYPLVVETNEWFFRDWAKDTVVDSPAYTNFLVTAGVYDLQIGLGGFMTFTVVDDDTTIPRLRLNSLRPTNGILAQYRFAGDGSTAPSRVDSANAVVGALQIAQSNASASAPILVERTIPETYAATAENWHTNQFWTVDLTPEYDLSITNLAFQCQLTSSNGPSSYEIQLFSGGTVVDTAGPYSLYTAPLNPSSWYAESRALTFDLVAHTAYEIRLYPSGATDAAAAMRLYDLTFAYTSVDTNGVVQVTDADLAGYGSYSITGSAWDPDSGIVTTNHADVAQWPTFELRAPNGAVAAQGLLGLAASLADGDARTEEEGGFTNALAAVGYTDVMLGAYTGTATLWDYDRDRANDQLSLNANLALYVVDNDVTPPGTVGTLRVNGVVVPETPPDRWTAAWTNRSDFLVTFDTPAIDPPGGMELSEKQRAATGIGEYRVAAGDVSGLSAQARAALGTPYAVATTNGALANYGFEIPGAGWTLDANSSYRSLAVGGTNEVKEGTNSLRQVNGGMAYQTIEFRNLAHAAPVVGVSGWYRCDSPGGATFRIEAFATNDLATPVATNDLALGTTAGWTAFALNPAEAVGDGSVELLKISVIDGGGNTTFWDDLRLSVDIATNLPAMRFVAGAENQGLNPQSLFAVDADNNRAGDRLAGEAAPFYIAYDVTPPTQVGSLVAATEYVNDPTTQFDLQWSTFGVGPDDPAHVHHPTKLGDDLDLLSPWGSYKVYYRTFDALDVPPADGGPGSETAYIYTNFIDNEAYKSWPSITAASAIHDPSAAQTDYAPLTNLNRSSIRLYDLDFDQDYAVVIVGVDQAGNEGDAGRWSWATNNTIKFSVTSAWMIAKTEAIQTFGSDVATNTAAPNTLALGWLAAGQKNGTGTVNRVYDLIYWDSGRFQESTNNLWQLAGSRQTNWFVDDGGQFRGRGQLRFYRASYQDRWRRTRLVGSNEVAQRPLASEEVYALHNVVLSGGQNFVALHGEPTINTFAGVFGGVETFPGASSPLDATVVEFFQPGENALATAQYYLDASGRWQQVGGSDVTDTVQASNFFMRGFSITLPDPLPGAYEATTAYDHNQVDENGQPVQVPAMIWCPVAQVPTNSYSQVIATGSRSGRAVTNVYNVAALRLPVAAHPAEMRLLESGFVNGPPDQSDHIYTLNTATKSVLSGSTIYCDAQGTWRFVSGNGLVPPGYFKPNDVIVIVSRNRVGNGSWTWQYHPGHFYELPTRWMEPQP